MSAALPDRFHLEIRLGREGDSEVWLATDETLDRPVLARIVGPNASSEHRSSFAAGVRAAAAVTHDHLAAVYAADDSGDTAYAVTEWAGGVTIQDRITAGEPIPLDDFLPNAAGLADALAKLHAADVIHGAIGPSAVLYSAAHPAKLSPYASLVGDAAADTAALAETLVTGLAGGATELPPSQLAEGLPRSVDAALRAARTGKLDAAGLAAALRAAPSPAAPSPRPEWTWRWVPVAGGLLVAALVVIALGFALGSNTDSALLFPVGQPPAPPTTAEAAVNTTAIDQGGTLPQPQDLVVTAVGSFDPFGDDGTERDRDVGLLIDGQLSTSWRTERYFDPLQLIKPGVGVVLATQGSVNAITIDGSAGTALMVGWAPQPAATFDEWSQLTTAVLGPESTTIEVPTQEGGAWLLWFTDLPPRDGGEYYYTTISEVRFSS
ncbi:MAG: hypothetical protein OES13_00780 [Acidimicrobiia bacterium]|nr:hypothetical protein [Acidimicrobiia bacterium]